MPDKVDIIIVNWNSGAKTIQAIKPYLNYQSSKIKCNAHVVDNASIDDSRALFNGVINNVIYNSGNEGFGKACNQAFVKCTGDYILLLNPDTKSDPGVLEKLVEFLNNNPGYAVTGPQQHDMNNGVLKTCCRFPNFKRSVFEVLGLSKLFPKIFKSFLIMTDWDHLQSRDVDHIMGSYMLIRKPVLDKIGFMDEDFFVYLEDVDLSKRINNAGYKSYFYSQCSIFHEGGGTGEKSKSKRLFYSFTSRRIYWRKHLGKTKSSVLVILSITAEPLLRIFDSFTKDGIIGIKALGKAYYLYIKRILNPNTKKE